MATTVIYYLRNGQTITINDVVELNGGRHDEQSPVYRPQPGTEVLLSADGGLYLIARNEIIGSCTRIGTAEQTRPLGFQVAPWPAEAQRLPAST